MAKLKKKSFPPIYAYIGHVDGHTVLFDMFGAPSVVFSMENPIQQLCTDREKYIEFHEVLINIVQTLGEGYAIQKQDVFCKQRFHKDVPDNSSFLTKSYFKYFEGRPYTALQTYLIITQEPQKNQFIKFDPKKWEEFGLKASKIADILSDKKINHKELDKKEAEEYVHRFMAFTFKKGPFSMNNFMAGDNFLKTGENFVIRSFPVIDVDDADVPGQIRPYTAFSVNGQRISTDMMDFLPNIPYADCVIYNQLIQVPSQRKLLSKLHSKSNRHGSMPGAANKLAKEDIDNVLDILAQDSRLLVKCNFNILVKCKEDKINQVSSFIENRLFPLNLTPSRHAINQFELFKASFPGNGYCMNDDYDLFLTLGEAALCFFYKERMKTDEITPLTTYYTDRQGLPVCIDITGKEGKNKLTDNANFFCIGPSGSGKSFHINSVVRQLLEQGTDVVMVDTGDSYEGISSYFNGVYISYSEEKPISMNPFKVTKEEYLINFVEKINFLKSLIFLIFKGNQSPSKLEDTIIDQTITEYYDAYFNPFTEFSPEEKESIRQELLITARMKSEDESLLLEVDKIDELISREPPKIESHALTLPSEQRKYKLIRQCRQFMAIMEDEVANEYEKQNAARMLEVYKRELRETSLDVDVDRQIAVMEKRKRRMRVNELSFNTYFEFALERIPQIMRQDDVDFDIQNFRKILKPFYRGGKREHTLNSDMDINLFDEKFIVFEIDKIKDDAILFPIVVLIIMDVFIQKMRIKKGRKALIIEEAWKAISSPTMAEYIKYLYKTVRKFHGIAGVVTQELNDIIDSPIVKEAIINNSDIKILLDQTKFKDRYDDISAILGLTDIQKQQIFTINSLNNKEGRNFFKEVWICRGLTSDVYGVEEPPECNWAYTTERPEKEALKIYKKYYGNIEEAIQHIEIDRKKAGVAKFLDFANMVLSHKKIMALWKD